MWPAFTKFFTGELPVNTFKRQFYDGSERAKEQRQRQGLAAVAAGKSSLPARRREAAKLARAVMFQRDEEVLDMLLNFAAVMARQLVPSNKKKELPGHLLKALRGTRSDAQAVADFLEAVSRTLKASTTARPAANHPAKKSSLGQLRGFPED